MVGAPVVAGSSLPIEGCKRQTLPPEVRRVLEEDSVEEKQREGGVVSLYRAVRNSRDEIVGALELLTGLAEKVDVSVRDMFVEPREPDKEDEE